MRKTAAYIVSLIFLFMAGLLILHPAYQAIASWLSPLTGGFIYTIFIVFTLLIANPFKYITVTLVWVLTGLIIGLISQKKLGSSIVAFLVWLSMIPTLGIAIFGVYTNLDARGVFTLDSVDQIINIIPNVPSQLNFNSLFHIPIINDLAFQLIDIIPTLGENTDPMQVMIRVAMPHATAFALKPVLIIVSAIAGAILGKIIFSKIDLSMLPIRKITALILIGAIVTQATYLPLTRAQPPELSEKALKMLATLGIDPQDLDMEALAEMGITVEDLEAIADIGLENINLETLTDMGIDPAVAIAIMMGGGGTGSGEGTGFELPINTDDGIYIELMEGYVENQGRAVTGEALIGSDIETIPPTAPYVQDLAASLILTQKIRDTSVLYTLPFEDIASFAQVAGIAPEIIAVNLYVGDDVELVTAKSDQLIDEYESLYGVQFSRISAMQQSFGQDEGASSEIPPLVVCVYYSVNTMDEIIDNILTGFESKNGVASSFQEVIEGERRDMELYVLGQISPSYLTAFIPPAEEMAMFQDLIDVILAETFHFVVGAQLIDNAMDSGSGNVFDLTNALNISAPSFSSYADIGAIAVIRPNSTDPEPFIKLAVNIDPASTEFMFLYMYLNTIMPMDINGGMIPDREDLQIVLPDYSAPLIDVEKTSQTSNGVGKVTVTITNDGSSTITDLALDDAFPEKYNVLSSGTNKGTWTRLSPGGSVSVSYEIDYTNPGTYTNMPAVLKYMEDGDQRTAVSNIPPVITKNPSGLALLSANYGATFGLVDKLTGRGDLFGMIPLVFVALIAAVDIFKMYRKRPKSGDQPPEEPAPGEPPKPEDTPEDPL